MKASLACVGKPSSIKVCCRNILVLQTGTVDCTVAHDAARGPDDMLHEILKADEAAPKQ